MLEKAPASGSAVFLLKAAATSSPFIIDTTTICDLHSVNCLFMYRHSKSSTLQIKGRLALKNASSRCRRPEYEPRSVPGPESAHTRQDPGPGSNSALGLPARRRRDFGSSISLGLQTLAAMRSLKLLVGVSLNYGHVIAIRTIFLCAACQPAEHGAVNAAAQTEGIPRIAQACLHAPSKPKYHSIKEHGYPKSC